MKLVFLDIDGVLNGHDFDQAAQSTRIQYRCIRELNRLIRVTGCKFVLSSAWRYMLLRTRRKYPPAMTALGFEYMMRTHGAAGFRLLGTTISDEDCEHCGHRHKARNVCPQTGRVSCLECSEEMNRGGQIDRWLKDNGADVTRYVVVDDLDLGISELGHPFVQTNGKWGLSRAKATEAIRWLS